MDKAIKPREDRVSCLSSCLVTAAAKSRQLCPTLCDPIEGSPLESSVHRLLSLGKITGVGCHFLLHYLSIESFNMGKAKNRESGDAQQSPKPEKECIYNGVTFIKCNKN